MGNPLTPLLAEIFMMMRYREFYSKKSVSPSTATLSFVQTNSATSDNV